MNKDAGQKHFFPQAEILPLPKSLLLLSGFSLK
jgi:hypothetical protein